MLMDVFFVLVVVDLRRVVSALWFWNDCAGPFDHPSSSWLGNGHRYLAYFCTARTACTRQLYQLRFVDTGNASVIVVNQVLTHRERFLSGRYFLADFNRDAFRFWHFQIFCRSLIEIKLKLLI
jgi:hypothetical protein